MPVEIKVSSDLEGVIKSLEGIKLKAIEVEKNIGRGMSAVESGISKSAKETESSLSTLRSFGARVANGLKDDFRALFSINAIADSLKLSNVFKSSVAQTMVLSDTIRKLAGTLGIAESRWAGFQSKMTKGLGLIGLSSEVASKSLDGLAQTRVRGEEQFVEYSRTAGMLTSLGRETGRENEVTKGLADVLTARGQDPNDIAAMKGLADSVRRVIRSTGRGPTESLSTMRALYEAMPQEMRKKTEPKQLATLAAAAQTAGPQSVSFITEILRRSRIDRLGASAMGFGRVFDKSGNLDMDRLFKASKRMTSMIGFDPEKSGGIAGLGEDAGRGMVRFVESYDRIKAAQAEVINSNEDLQKAYEDSRGFAESFRSALDRVKAPMSSAIGYVTQGATDIVSSAAKSDTGSMLLAGGGATAAALLAGYGVRGVGRGLGGLGKGLLGGALASKASEAITGEKVQNVYVVNAAEIAAGGTIASGAGGILKRAGMVLGPVAALAGGVAAGSALAEGQTGKDVRDYVNRTTQGTNKEGFTGDVLDRFLFRLDSILGGRLTGISTAQESKIIVESRVSNLEVTQKPGRGR